MYLTFPENSMNKKAATNIFKNIIHHFHVYFRSCFQLTSDFFFYLSIFEQRENTRTRGTQKIFHDWNHFFDEAYRLMIEKSLKSFTTLSTSVKNKLCFIKGNYLLRTTNNSKLNSNRQTCLAWKYSSMLSDGNRLWFRFEHQKRFANDVEAFQSLSQLKVHKKIKG